MSIIAILTTIISGAELAVKAGEVASKLIPETPKELKDKFRWVKCTIKNETQFDVLLEASHFDSGRYWTPPGGFA
ncbi:hypothetical protein C8Q72DRAFT_886421 [Fomitopsis betulina]|nr:hypothetical protein C8Q72DRAFT_886421 [Fomitopsis betulina]